MIIPQIGWKKSGAAQIVAVALVYFGVARASLLLSFASSNASPVWPPSGIAIAALLLLGARVWPAVTLGAFGANLATFLAAGTTGLSQAIFASLAIAIGNTGEALVTRWIACKWQGDGNGDSVGRVFAIAGAAVAGALVSSSCGVLTLVEFAVIPRAIAGTVWLTWALGDLSGMLVVAPVLLKLRTHATLPSLRRAAVLAGLFAALLFVVFSDTFQAGHVDRLLAFGLVAFVAWTSYRHGRLSSALAVFVIAAVSVTATISGHGPFAKSTVNDSLISLDVFLVLCALCGLVLAAPRQDASSPGAEASAATRRVPAFVLVTSLGATMLGWHLLSLETERRAQSSFQDISDDIRDAVLTRMRSYEQILRGARGFIEGSNEGVDEGEWHRYYESLDLGTSYPGMQGIGYAAHIRGTQRASFEDSIRKTNPEYRIHPPGSRGEYDIVLYIEPHDVRNARAFGYVLNSEAVRADALTRARDTGTIAVTGKTTLVQEIDANVQSGFLMFAPVYRPGAPLRNARERDDALIAYAYSVFRMGDLMQDVLRQPQFALLALRIHDGDDASPSTLMYENRSAREPGYLHQLQRSIALDVGDHRWTVDLRTTARFEASIDTEKAQIALLAGAVISLLLFSLTRSYAARRDDAVRVAEQQMLQARADLSATVDALPALVGSWDTDLRTRFCNNEYRHWFGIDPTLAKGKHIVEVVGMDLYKKNLPYIERVLQGETQSFERDIVCVDGRVRHTLTRYLPDVQNGVQLGYFVLVFDITHQKKIEGALEEGLRLHDAIFSHASVGIAWVRDGRLERVSRRCAQLLGYDDYELDHELAEVIFPNDSVRDQVGNMAREMLPAGKTLELELALRCKDGTTAWCRLMQRAIEPSDPAKGSIWIIDDFRDRKQREDLLQEARATAESVARMKSSFLANMSHEIRTPMNAIIGMTQLTLDSELDQRQRENLVLVHESAEALLRLLNDILDFSKLEAGKMELSPTEIDVREEFGSTLQRMGIAAEAKGLELVLDVAPDVPERVNCDSGRLMQVVTNLCGNAIKFTASGHVVCRVEVVERPEDGAELRVSVRDTGVGIPAAARERIFDSFVQADSSVTRQFGGTGLGLAISSQIVGLMKGKIEVDSEPGVGSDFHFTVPVEARAPAPRPSAEDLAAWRGKTVPLAVANAQTRTSLARLLRSWDVRTIEFAHADELFAATRLAAKFDAGYPVIVLDEQFWANLPDDRRAQEREASGAPGVILLGGTRHGAIDATACVRKPLRHGELRRALLSALHRKEVGAAPARVAPAVLPVKAERSLDILVADDHPVNQKLAERLLQQRGHKVTLVSDGAQAVAAAIAGTFDVILMDVQMPELDGVGATARIRAAESVSGRHVPIVALTAHALAGERERLLEAGMDDYLSKPYAPRALIDLVERIANASTLTPSPSPAR